MRELLELVRNARVFDLAQPYFTGMPHYPTHPPFLFSLTKRHGETVLANGASSAAESIALGGHVGTHIDALCHYSRGGKLYGGVPVTDSFGDGVEALSIDTVAPVLRRGVLLDIAGAGVLPENFEVRPEHLEAARRAAIEPGDVVLLRTGWARYWNEPRRFINGVRGPGPAVDGARWLSERGVFAVGSDTVAFEKVPSPEMAVHTHLIAEHGIHIIECLNLEELAAAEITEFLFVAAPLKIRGGTGSPVRPLAIAQPPPS
jgi:kynurenine formamidase